MLLSPSKATHNITLVTRWLYFLVPSREFMASRSDLLTIGLPLAEKCAESFLTFFSSLPCSLPKVGRSRAKLNEEEDCAWLAAWPGWLAGLGGKLAGLAGWPGRPGWLAGRLAGLRSDSPTK